MRRLLVLCLLLAATSALAAQLTVNEILAAYRAGASKEGMLALVNGAESVAALSAADLDALRGAGVSEEVVQAWLARTAVQAPVAAAAAPPVATSMPDNPKLVELVTLYKSGMSEALLADVIRGNGVLQRPSVTDLIYLKQNQIPDSIISALMEAKVVGAPVAPVAAGAYAGVPQAGTMSTTSGETIFEGLVLKTGTFAKNRNGRLVLLAEKLEWRDGMDQSKNFELFVKGIQRVTILCQGGAEENFCYSVKVEMNKGEDYAFEDAKKEMGGNEAIMNLLTTLKTQFPRLAYNEKIKK